MISFKEYFEKYTTPSNVVLLERCIPPMDILSKYKDDDNAFLSFTDQVEPRGQKHGEGTTAFKSTTKIGINPWSSYDTPIGVYFYPIKPYWDNLQRRNIDFAGNKPHLYVVKAKNPEKLLRGSRYSDSDYQRDKEKLQEIFHYFDMDFKEAEISSEYKKNPAQKFWSLTRSIAQEISHRNNNKPPVIWTQIMRRFYDGVVDDNGVGFIHENEPTQAVIWTKAQFDVVDYIDRTCGGRIKGSDRYTWNKPSEDEMIAKMLRIYMITGKVDPRYKEDVKHHYKNILLSPQKAFTFAENVLKWKKIPKEIINAIAYSASYSYAYANYVLKWENVPEVILDGISRDGEFSFYYADLKKGEVPEKFVKSIIENKNEYYVRQYTQILANMGKLSRIFQIADLTNDPLDIDSLVIKFLSRDIKWAYKLLLEILIPRGIDVGKIFEVGTEENHKFRNIVAVLLEDEKYLMEISKKYFKGKDIPILFDDNFLFKLWKKTRLQFQNITESFTAANIDMDRAYEIFNQEYLQSTGKSWNKGKFLSRANNWDFWGDENGFVTTRNQNSGFVKLVGAAGSDKSKYKGFKELSAKNLPVWGMVDEKIRELLKKMGYRGPNIMEKMAFKALMKSGQMNAVLGGATLDSIDGDKVTLTYPDIGTVTKYFVGSPQYWKKLHWGFLKKESSEFDMEYQKLMSNVIQ